LKGGLKMVIPEELIVLIKEAKKELKSHSNGELVLPIRKKILKTFGEYESELGKKRRTKLDVLCVEYAMPVWNHAKPKATRTPLELTNLIEDFFQNKISEDDLDRIKDSYWTEMDNLGQNYRYQLATEVGYAAINAICVAMVDRYFLYEDEFPEGLDEGGDPYDWDASFFISGAVAGFPWNKGQQPDFRRQYWNWYLDKAVPEAYNAYR
jgi:hypothetical protein